MSLQAPDIVSKAKPVLVEGVFIFFIGIIIVANTTMTDITFHDNYVLPAISTCFPTNQEQFCVDIRERMGLPNDAQLEIGLIYWDELARQAVFIGFILFIIRIAFGYFLELQGIRKVRSTTFLMALFWGLVGGSLFIFGFLDTLYYVFQIDMPTEVLSHLDNAGIFTFTITFTGDIDTVAVTDLYLTNILGLVVIFSFLFIMMYAYSHNGLKNRGIA